MGAKIISGNELSKKIRQQLRVQVEELNRKGIYPGLAVVLVGSDPASQIYVNRKQKACEELGILSYPYALDEKTSEEELLTLISDLNKDPKVNGILVQLPLPAHINEDKIIPAISPDKDVDAFHPENTGRIMNGNPVFLPCTPAGIMELIKESGMQVEGKKCVVVGRSNIVGKPMAMLLMAANGTVTICHSRTRDLEEECRKADILVAAIGRPEYIKGSFIKPGAVVIDVGMNRLESGKLVGDVEFSTACEIASAITPVPGGVGPMTITMLMKNTITAAISK
ncbi:MAG: bifunctional methylenetetrahydrofolate dehydrogenase/methenyltetrahydrofolate cyclohydrolase FolD [Clostridiaceae bacterium]|jgi:methylenetetrahydrofolate dehydrogenase (NADP+)/methenyltetrahydrofolate cyclohydrolase|nr:bifunctional methylenetetrahydrofolate dehydrogenase/methenyltetrahydrofolate cyclohydrolase FolD [Clostridiaceae bacterium]